CALDAVSFAPRVCEYFDTKRTVIVRHLRQHRRIRAGADPRACAVRHGGAGPRGFLAYDRPRARRRPRNSSQLWPEESASCKALAMHPSGTTMGPLDLASAIAPNRSKNHSLAIPASG